MVESISCPCEQSGSAHLQLQVLCFTQPQAFLWQKLCCLQKTRASHRLQDDVPADVKRRRLEELIAVFREEAARANEAMVGQAQLVLVEGVSVFVRAVCLPSCCPRGS